MDAKDIRGGDFGSDENLENNFTFATPVYFDNKLYSSNGNFFLDIGRTSQLNQVDAQGISTNKINARTNNQKLDFTGTSKINQIDSNTINAQTLRGDELCIRGSGCYNSWSDSLVYNFPYVMNFDYLNKASESNRYNYPYIDFEEIYQELGGSSSNNQYKTEWFNLANSYFTPYRQRLTALYAIESDNSKPASFYRVNSPNQKRNSNDYLKSCAWFDNGKRVLRDGPSVEDCESVGASRYYYMDSTLPDGRVVLEISQKAGRNGNFQYCGDVNYIGTMALGRWGDPNMVEPQLGDYVIPQESDCYGARSLHSQIVARYVVQNYLGDRSTLQEHFNYYSSKSIGIVHAFDEVGVNYLKTR